MRAVLGVLLTLLVVAPAHAAPTLEIRARAELQIAAEPLGQGFTRVRIHMSDDVGAPMPLARVVVEGRSSGASCGIRASCVTRRDGNCELRLRGCDADEVRASFEGTDSVDGLETIAGVQSGRAATTLELRLEHGTTIDLDDPTARLHVTRRGSPIPTAHIELTDELGRSILTRELGAEGESVLLIPTTALGPPGVGAIVAKLLESDQRETSARLMIVRQLESNLQLRLKSRRGRRFAAALRNSAGPIGAALVTLRCDGARIGEATTDAAGRATFTLPKADESRECQAEFHPNMPGRTAATSAKVRLPATPRPILLSVLPWASLAFAFVLMGLLTRRRQNIERPAPARANVAPKTIEHSAPSQLVRSLHRVVIHAMAAEDDGPLPDAELSVDEGEKVRADATGRFELDLAGRPIATLVVSARGRAPETLRIRCPHRGEWSDVRVRLETTRMYARRAIEIVARAASRNDDEAAALTLREAERRLAATRDPAFPEEAEQQVYGEEEPSLEDARSLVDRGRERITPQAGPSSS